MEDPAERHPCPGAGPGFNGATTLKSWKTPSSPNNFPAKYLLQWGHDVEVVEDATVPPCFAHVAPGLQWGHDVEVVEDEVLSENSPSPNGLQWGHDVEVVEDRK